MVVPIRLSSAVASAERTVQAELAEAERSFQELFSGIAAKTRRKAREVLEEDPRQREARETIEHLQLRLELLRNIRMNWGGFQRRLTRSGMTMRINQDAHLRHLVAFLETGKGVALGDEDEVDVDIDPSRAMMTHEVQPTGAGKTGAFAIDIALMDVPSLTLVPLDPLLGQTKKDMVKIGGIPEDEIGIVGGGAKDFADKKHVVATYAGHMAMMRKGGPYAKFMKTKCKLVICDEVHYQALGDRTQASIQQIDDDEGIINGTHTEEEAEMLDAEREVLSNLSAETAVKSLKIGFTATPRGSQKHVRHYFPHCLGRVYHRQMIEAGSVVPYKIVHCDGSIYEGDMEGYMTQEQEAEILDREGIYGKLAGEYAEALATYRKVKKSSKEYPLRGMAFCTNHAECEKFVEEAEQFGLRCRIVTGKEAQGKKSQEVIDAAMDALSADEIDLVVTVEKLAVGFNRPEINSIVWARITSAAKTIQCVGRGGRAHTDDLGRIKKECLVFETNWTLRKNAKKKARKPMRLADALAFNGEEPEAICSMADGSPLAYESPELQRKRVREILAAQFTPSSWRALKHRDSKGNDFAGTGMGLQAIATLFGVIGDVKTAAPRDDLGRVLWPDSYGDANSEEQKRARISAIITTEFTPSSWARLKSPDCRGKDFAGTGMGLISIGRLFGIDGDLPCNASRREDLARVLWPGMEAEFDLKAQEQARVRTILVAQFTPDTWSRLRGDELRGKDFAGTDIGIYAIGTLFGIEGDPVESASVRHELGSRLWPDTYGNPEADTVETRRENVRRILAARFTALEWSRLRRIDCNGKDFAGTGMGLYAIGNLFGVEGDPVDRTASRHQLGRMLFGDKKCFTKG